MTTLNGQFQGPEVIVQKNLEAYNKRNISVFMGYFSDEIAVYNFNDNTPTLKGLEQVETFYQKLFDNSPALYSEITKRIVIGNKVIDHERITGRNKSNDIIEFVLIYEVHEQLINKITVVK